MVFVFRVTIQVSISCVLRFGCFYALHVCVLCCAACELCTAARQDVTKAWNEEASHANDEARARNAPLLQLLDEALAAGTSTEAVLSELQTRSAPWVQPLEMSMQRCALSKAASRFLSEFGHTSFHNKKPGKHLPYDHESMCKFRNFVNSLETKKGL